MKERTKKFTIDSSYLCSKSPTTREYNAYINQLIRCSSSVGAQLSSITKSKIHSGFH